MIGEICAQDKVYDGLSMSGNIQLRQSLASDPMLSFREDVGIHASRIVSEDEETHGTEPIKHVETASGAHPAT